MQGFTLAEVLIAIVVISILVAGAFPVLASYAHQIRFAHVFQDLEERFYDANAKALAGLPNDPLNFTVGNDEFLQSISFRGKNLSELYLSFEPPFAELHFQESLASSPLDEACASTPKECFVTLSYGLPETSFRKTVTITLQKHLNHD